MIAKGSAASPGAACGKVCFTQDEALAAKANKEDAILVTVMTSQEDVKGMKASRGILTTTGTKVSHAAIMATAWGIPAVVGASEITIDKAAGTFSCNGHTVKRGDYITISGTTGEVYLGKVPMTVPSKLEESAQAILDWCQEIKSLDVRANAEAAETEPAFNKGARGVGLFRTEHMFLGDRLPYIQKVLFGNDKDEAKKALDAIYNFSKDDFKHSRYPPSLAIHGEGGGTAAKRLGGR